MIEGVTVSVGHGDFLAETLPINLALVDEMVVLTSPDDAETREVCRRHSVHCVVSEDHKRGGEFNKARLIQRGFDQISRSDWVLHIDADCVLPRRFRDLLSWSDLDTRGIYGFDRCNVTGWDAWQAIKQKGGWDNHGYENLLRFQPDATVGARWVSKLHGYVPIGFSQLYFGPESIFRGTHAKRYPYHHGDAARSDVQFALCWDRKHRHLLPEVIVLHLESEKAKLGANWKGRTTARFGPKAKLERHNGPS
jgi:Glycosyltransferase like family 2